ncbi:hypothetical protein C8Q75DRAFT_868489 [Abortiporus biennis]|nr:hypothetical protein C8Q75DRAFT_868489 [Abortiporus biennis]
MEGALNERYERPVVTRSSHVPIVTVIDFRRRIIAQVMASTHIPNPSPSLETEPKRCQELWFEDGTIVLQAEDSTLFRVYAGHLSRYSIVFADMLSLPKSPNYNCNDQHEGCPLVKLSDSSSNLRAYLLSILDVKFYLKLSSAELALEDVIGILHLSTNKPLDDILDSGITSSGQAVNLDPVIFRLVVKSRRELEHLSQTRTLEYIFYWSGNDPVLDCRDSEEKGMDSVWKDLPSVFNLPNWDDLTRKPEVE